MNLHELIGKMKASDFGTDNREGVLVFIEQNVMEASNRIAFIKELYSTPENELKIRNRAFEDYFEYQRYVLGVTTDFINCKLLCSITDLHQDSIYERISFDLINNKVKFQFPSGRIEERKISVDFFK